MASPLRHVWLHRVPSCRRLDVAHPRVDAPLRRGYQRRARRRHRGPRVLTRYAPRLRRRSHRRDRQHHEKVHGRGEASDVRRFLLLTRPLDDRCLPDGFIGTRGPGAGFSGAQQPFTTAPLRHARRHRGVGQLSLPDRDLEPNHSLGHRQTVHSDAPGKMYPLGVLFGLGFDTATEVAFLVLTGTVVAGGLPFWAVLSLPILFAAGMSLLDTIDGSFMNFAYGWAFSKPVRKVYYNIAITGLSVFVAFYI